jgi:hypothetical protein
MLESSDEPIRGRRGYRDGRLAAPAAEEVFGDRLGRVGP